MCYFRRLRADEIECRVSTFSEKGCSLLLYKNARVDQNLLDEKFGIFGWQRTHEVINGNLYCTISIKNPETGEWVSKQDVGVESFTEKEKGAASDSFKRSAFNWGIGRELYTAPFIWISAENVNLTPKGDNKYTTYDRFYVSDIGYDDKGNINYLVIYNEKKKCKVYTMGAPETKEVSYVTAEQLQDVKKELMRTGVSEEDILKRYGIKTITEMTLPIYTRCMEALKKSKDKE